MAAEFFQEANGAKSSTRVIFVIGVLWAIAMTTLGFVMLHWAVGEGVAFFTASSAVFIGLKLGQKPMEAKTNGQVTP
jgi:hypothetical protein